MSAEMMFTVKITATGEVRDADGNLISSSPMEGSRTMSGSELKTELGLTDDQIRDLSEGETT